MKDSYGRYAAETQLLAPVGRHSPASTYHRNPVASRSSFKKPDETPKTTAKARRVRFGIDATGEVQKQVFTYDKVAREYFSEMYYSRQAMGTFVHLAKLKAANAAATASAEISELETAFCNSRKENISDEQRMKDAAAMLQWARSDLRGLEGFCSSLFCRKQVKAMKKAMKFRSVSLKLLGTGESADDAFANYCAETNERAQKFAQVIACCDQHVVS